MRVKILLKYCILLSLVVISIDGQTEERDQIPERPKILFNRWQEDWSVLANPNVPREPLDDLKYIPLSKNDPKTYLSLGVTLRDRFEYNDAMNKVSLGVIITMHFLQVLWCSLYLPHAGSDLGDLMLAFHEYIGIELARSVTILRSKG